MGVGPQQVFMTFGDVTAAAFRDPDEGRQLGTRPSRGEILDDRLPNDGRHGLLLLPRVELQIALERLRDEDRGTFHMTYDIICATRSAAHPDLPQAASPARGTAPLPRRRRCGGRR